MAEVYALRTTAGRETQVIDKLIARTKQYGLYLYAILKPREVKGYFFVEAGSIDDLNKAIYGVQHAKGVIGTVKMQEIQHFLVPAQEQIKIQVGDIVEIVSGPFRGETAKVKRVTKVKDEVVVELLEAAVPIPITVKLDSVRVIKPEEKGERAD